MVILRKQIAFAQDNLTGLGSGIKETFDDLDNFQPDEAFGRNIEILFAQISMRASMQIAPVAADFYWAGVELQVSSSAKFGIKSNVLGVLHTMVGRVTGATTIGVSGVANTEEETTIGNFQFPLMRVTAPGAIYLHEEMFNLSSSGNIGAGLLKTAGSCVIYYRQL